MPGYLIVIGGNVAEKAIANPTVLAIFPAGEDRTSLAKILAPSDWNVTFIGNFPDAQTALRRSLPGVVISDCRFSDGHCWKDLLYEMGEMGDPPPLIVADRLADERLWAEVLNLGAYDLLAKPFDGREVVHALTTACRRREHKQAIGGARKPARSARSGGETGLSVGVGSGG